MHPVSFISLFIIYLHEYLLCCICIFIEIKEITMRIFFLSCSWPIVDALYYIDKPLNLNSFSPRSYICTFFLTLPFSRVNFSNEITNISRSTFNVLYDNIVNELDKWCTADGKLHSAFTVITLSFRLQSDYVPDAWKYHKLLVTCSNLMK